MKHLIKLIALMRRIYRFPGVKQLVEALIKSYFKDAIVRKDTTVDEKLDLAVTTALQGENYKAVLNGKGKYAKIIAKAEKSGKKA